MGQDVLTDHEKELVEQLKAEVRPIILAHTCLLAWANEHTYVRYLRARQWNLAKASKMLKATLDWRLEYKPHLITWDQVESEGTTGKQFVYPALDKNGRPVVLMRPRNQNTKDTDKQVRHLIYTLEVASRIADEQGVGKFAWLLDFQGYTMANAPPLRVSLHCNSVLANHYPERLGLAVCYHAPVLFSYTYKAVQPFLDPVTKAKIVFVDKGAQEKEMMEARFDMSAMEQSMGGGLPGCAYDHAQYGERMRKHDAEVAAALRAAESHGAAAAAGGGKRCSTEVDHAAVGEAMEKLAVTVTTN